MMKKLLLVATLVVTMLAAAPMTVLARQNPNPDGFPKEWRQKRQAARDMLDQYQDVQQMGDKQAMNQFKRDVEKEFNITFAGDARVDTFLFIIAYGGQAQFVDPYASWENRLDQNGNDNANSNSNGSGAAQDANTNGANTNDNTNGSTGSTGGSGGATNTNGNDNGNDMTDWEPSPWFTVGHPSCRLLHDASMPQFDRLANRYNTTSDVVADYSCAGRNFMDISRAYKMADKYGVSVDIVFQQHDQGMSWDQIADQYNGQP
jgi:hypothetical protein